MVIIFFHILSLIIAILLMKPITSLMADECAMSIAFNQPDGNAEGGSTPVWSDETASSLLFIESLNVNTDGTRRSYSVHDFWGEHNALNNLCNAMTDGCKGLSSNQKQDRRIITQKAASNNWPKSELLSTKISSEIIPFKSGKPCPEIDGFLVSATALHAPKISDVCDITNYIGSLTTSALVLPESPKHSLSGFAKRNARIGDLVVAMRPAAKDVAYAVVGDLGPANELGEGSIALNGSLLGKTALPINYREIRGKPPFVGKAWTVPKAIVIIFPGTKDSNNPFMTQDRINAAAEQRFIAWGGIGRP